MTTSNFKNDQFTNMISMKLEDLDNIAIEILKKHSENRIFILQGEMGSGKTTLIKALCKQLNVIDIVSSPTFALVNVYNTSKGLLVYHFDFYRIKSIEEAYDIGYEEYLYSNNYSFIEWPEKIESLIPKDAVYINIKVNSIDNLRTISY